MTLPATFAAFAPSADDVRAAAILLQGVADPRRSFTAAARRLTGAAYAALWEPDGEATTVVTAVDGNGPRLGQRLGRGQGNAPARVLATGERVLAMEARGHAWVDQSIVTRLRLRSLLCEPVVRGDQPIAALALGWQDPLEDIDETALAFLTLLCAQAGVAIERSNTAATLREQARTDGLTGLLNRRALGDEVLREMARSRRTGTRLGFGVLDLDHFKQINDRHGHAIGDRVLVSAARSWSERLRDVDVLARYGGEEFVVLLPDVGSLDQAARAVERLRRATPVPVTASAGVAVWDGAEGPGELLQRADDALYRAKAAGRDQLAIAPPVALVA